MNTSGLLTFKSDNSVKETANRLITLFEEKGINLFAHIDHAIGASKIDIELRSTQVIIFGNPATGSPLMVENQTVGIDLPQKALIWQDKNDDNWLAFNDPHFLAKRHNLETTQPLIENLQNAFNQFAKHATKS